MSGRFIALEGPDGIGKSTLAARLAELTYDQAAAALDGRRSHPAVGNRLVLVPRRQITSTVPYAATLMEHLSTMLWHSGDDPCLTDAFWVSLQAAWGVAHSETVLTPLLDAGYDVLVDGWFYKFFAKLGVQGWNQTDIDTVFAHVRMPDAVILLTGDLGAVYDRRSHDFRPAELGMHAGYARLDRDTFIEYQQAALQRLSIFADRLGWSTVHLDPGHDVSTAAATMQPHLQRALLAATPARTHS